jgi:type IV secretory pathway TrbD component
MSLEPIHKSLHRPQLFLGVDRDLAMYTILVALITGLGGYSILSLLSALAFLVVAMRFLRIWAKKDPLLRDVFMRYVRYVRVDVLFPAKPGAFSQPRPFVWKARK